MASLRLCFLNSILKNTTRTKANNFCFEFCRMKHSLCRSQLMFAVNEDSPKLFSNVHKYWLVCRLEHGVPAGSNVTPVVNNTSQSSESLLKNNDTTQVVENFSGTGIIGDNKGATENVNFMDYSELPPIPDSTVTIIEETSLKALGLAGWSPPGIVQQILEFFHVSFDVPWWAAIVGLTFTLRFFMIPFTIKMKRDVVNYSNNMPYFQHLQNKIAEAKNSGSYFEVAQLSQELCKFMEEKKLFTFGMAVPYLVQMPVFISVFLALKRMAETPELKSFETGGLLWFTDLSAPDQFYILPLMTAGTVWLTLKFGGGAETLKASATHVQALVQVLIPTVIFLVTMHFPAATVCYWTTTNIFVLVQNSIMSYEPIRKYLNIPLQIKTVPMEQPLFKGKGIVEGFKESFANMKIAREIEDRERLNAIRFEENSRSPVRRTYKFNPKEVPNLMQKKETK